MSHVSSARGFSLTEVILAAAILVAALTTLAHVVAAASSQSTNSRRGAAALALAQAKLEELRSLPWRFNPDGSRFSSVALNPSPANALTQDIGSWTEALDRFGGPANVGRPAHYHRRWSVASFTPLDPDALTLQVCVVAVSPPDALPDACVAAVRMRKP